MRVTLYIPDDLGREMEEFRAELKLSQLFQTSLKRKLKRLRALSRGDGRKEEGEAGAR